MTATAATPSRAATLLLSLLSAAGVASYAGLSTPPRTSPAAAPAEAAASPFSAVGLQAHTMGLDETAEEAIAPSRLEVVAPPRALPKPATSGAGSDPLGLWDTPTPRGPRGPSVFKLNQGRAIDVLRKDYPKLFVSKPDLSIFREDVELHDPSGKRLSGLRQYGRVFDMLRFLRSSCMQDAEITYRLVVSDDTIKVRWAAKLWMRDPALGLTSLLDGTPALVHLDGVSNYDLDADGKIRRHRLENIVLRGDEAAPPVQLKMAWPTPAYATPELALPLFKSFDSALTPFLRDIFDAPTDTGRDAASSHARQPDTHASPAPSPRSSSSSSRASYRRSSPPQACAARETPMERAARERAEDASKAARLSKAREEAQAAQDRERGGLFGVTMPQPCTTSYDCESPMVCCDLMFGSVCCSGGLMIPTRDPQVGLQRQAIPIPVERDDPSVPPQYPGGPM